MIKNFSHKGLHELFTTRKSAKVAPHLQKRILARLDTLEAAIRADDMNLPGYDFHPLTGTDRYTVHVNGPWCITFRFDKDAYDVDLEQYH